MKKAYWWQAVCMFPAYSGCGRWTGSSCYGSTDLGTAFHRMCEIRTGLIAGAQVMLEVGWELMLERKRATHGSPDAIWAALEAGALSKTWLASQSWTHSQHFSSGWQFIATSGRRALSSPLGHRPQSGVSLTHMAVLLSHCLCSAHTEWLHHS